MTPDETVRFVAACRAAMPGWTPLDGTAEIWHTAAFSDIALGDAHTALLEHVRDEGGWPDSAKLRRRAITASRRRLGKERQTQLGGPPGFCGVPGCGCTAAAPVIANANAAALQRSIRNVFRAAP